MIQQWTDWLQPILLSIAKELCCSAQEFDLNIFYHTFHMSKPFIAVFIRVNKHQIMLVGVYNQKHIHILETSCTCNKIGSN